ncbi:hypothetical protein T190_02420 [Sinorhizobium meliloti CCBAU 01290]|nr:hypothetical protein T190_02420 [Sinorhizobium meliloti CCBAU 01290]
MSCAAASTTSSFAARRMEPPLSSAVPTRTAL